MKLILLLVCISITCQTCPILFSINLVQMEPQNLTHLIETIPPQTYKECVEHLIKHGMVEEAFTLYKRSNLTTEQIRYLFDRQLNKLTTLQQSIITGSSTIEPVIKWGQSGQKIFIIFKLSHRWDTPTCNQPHSQQYWIQYDRWLIYYSKCVVSRQSLNFRLVLQLKQMVKNDTLTIKKDGVGTYIATVDKVDNFVWDSLQVNGKKRAIWKQIREKYPSAMDLYDNVTEQKRKKKFESEKFLTQNLLEAPQ